MPNLYDYAKFQTYLFELESALSYTALSECEGLHADTQLSAAIYAFLRATSLFRAALSLLESGLMDACDVVRRAYWEAWMLGYEFRLKDSSIHTMHWHLEKHKHSVPDLKKIKAFEASHSIPTPKYGSDYGGLSEVSHPTKSAAENSLVTVTALHANPDSRIHLKQARDTMAQEDAPMIMYLLIWTVIGESPDMISLAIKPEAVPTAFSFYNDYEREYSSK